MLYWLDNYNLSGSLKVAADGGANFVYDKLGDGENVLPDLITGDMDSIRDGVMWFYKDKVVKLTIFCVSFT